MALRNPSDARDVRKGSGHEAQEPTPNTEPYDRDEKLDLKAEERKSCEAGLGVARAGRTKQQQVMEEVLHECRDVGASSRDGLQGGIRIREGMTA